MKIFKTLSLLSAFGSAGFAGASGTAHYLHVKVPFAFVVAGQQFAAGEYEVEETDTGIITVQGSGRATEVISTPLESPKQGEGSNLRFTKTEDGAHLVSISVEGEGTRSIPARLRSERRLALSSR